MAAADDDVFRAGGPGRSARLGLRQAQHVVAGVLALQARLVDVGDGYTERPAA